MNNPNIVNAVYATVGTTLSTWVSWPVFLAGTCCILMALYLWYKNGQPQD